MHPIVRVACVVGLLLAGDSVRAADVEDRARTERVADFDAFCRFVADDYAYFDRKKTDWPAVCEGARAAAADAPDRAAFVGVVERALGELYDFHAHLGTSTPQSPRLVPTDADLYAQWRGDVATIVDVRAASGARDAGLRPGMRVIAIDGRTVGEVVAGLMPKHLRSADPAACDWALRVALAGHQDRQPVRLVVDQDGVRRELSFVPHRERPDRPLTARRIGRIGVVEVHNTLGDTRLIAAFDAALDGLADAQAIVLDLRDTPSGGNTTVARGLMSRFVVRESPYQKHERIAEWRDSGVRHVWIEMVGPRGQPFTRPVAVLVGRWTGSMGEGIAIGLNAARGAPVFGTPMAGLLGALDEQRLVHADFVVRVPAERLSHVDGTPRESFRPCPVVVRAADAGDDPVLTAVVRLMSAAKRRCSR